MFSDWRGASCPQVSIHNPCSQPLQNPATPVHNPCTITAAQSLFTTSAQPLFTTPAQPRFTIPAQPPLHNPCSPPPCTVTAWSKLVTACHWSPCCQAQEHRHVLKYIADMAVGPTCSISPGEAQCKHQSLPFGKSWFWSSSVVHQYYARLLRLVRVYQGRLMPTGRTVTRL